ncbi:glycosyltransferase family 2 protein [Pedobacter frigiditerrae]|uniref:Glycosyltransferase family 2 protein n=1 Tax=Pedobacter frigiditerrae TaxID=2530452 RepID=A0A4R0N3L3_9SPHI|nr:glycosyltransferase family 2 protein [Pedobacter frigiditerrae]TCC93953.1 glycosyltransferase family 2 protein [Pedobacter frigiditerrae]
MKPLVSIITPCYNSADFIVETINSVISQTYENWEMIIVDDNSSDNSRELVEELIKENHKIQLISLKENGRVSNARNVGLAAAKGKYIAFLDSDDIWLKDKLSLQVSIMEEKSLVLTFGAYKRIDEAGEIISITIIPPTTVNYKQLLGHNVIIFSSSMVLKSALDGIVLKNVGHEDWVFWLDLMKKNIIGYGIKEELIYYRIRKGSVSSNKLKVIGYTWKILRESEKLGFIESVYHFTKYAFATVWKRLR